MTNDPIVKKMFISPDLSKRDGKLPADENVINVQVHNNMYKSSLPFSKLSSAVAFRKPGEVVTWDNKDD